jgi:tRNA G46 methylase TrmB
MIAYNADMWFLLILVIMAVVAAAYLWHSWFELTNSISWVPLPRRVLPEIIKALEVKPGSVVYDLGCGDGRVLDAVVKTEPKARCIGVENNVVITTLLKIFGDQRVHWIRGDLRNVDLSSATHIYAYLSPDLNRQLVRHLPKGCRVVTVQYPLPGKKPLKAIRLDGPAFASRLYTYTA